jgi:hypothetical protein
MIKELKIFLKLAKDQIDTVDSLIFKRIGYDAQSYLIYQETLLKILKIMFLSSLVTSFIISVLT